MLGAALCGEPMRARGPISGYDGRMADARRVDARRGGARTKAHERLRCVVHDVGKHIQEVGKQIQEVGKQIQKVDTAKPLTLDQNKAWQRF